MPFPVRSALKAPKRLKELINVRRRDFRPGVLDDEDGLTGPAAGRDVDEPGRDVVAQRVVEQVGDETLDESRHRRRSERAR